MISKFIKDIRFYLSYRKTDTGRYPILNIEIILKRYLPRQVAEAMMVLYEQSIHRWLLRKRRKE